MVLDEKRLAGALKKSGTAGFKLLAEAGDYYIIGHDWAVELQISKMPELPRLLLAALVEMLGYIPDDCCISISKGSDDWVEQAMDSDVFKSELETYRGYRGRDSEEIEQLPLALGSRRLFQTRDKRIFSVDYGIGFGRFEAPRLQSGSCVYSSDDNSCIWARAYRPEEPDGIWQKLETIDWRAEVKTQETADQMEMSDE